MAGKVIAQDGVDVTPSDTIGLSEVGALYIGTGGDVAVTTELGTDLVFTNCPDGSFLPVNVKKVLSTGTTASGLILTF